MKKEPECSAAQPPEHNCDPSALGAGSDCDPKAVLVPLSVLAQLRLPPRKVEGKKAYEPEYYRQDVYLRPAELAAIRAGTNARYMGFICVVRSVTRPAHDAPFATFGFVDAIDA